MDRGVCMGICVWDITIFECLLVGVCKDGGEAYVYVSMCMFVDVCLGEGM